MTKYPWPLLCLLLCALPVAADSVDAARAAFDEGKLLFLNKKYDAAAEKFREANKLKPHWKLLYNIGQSEAAAKRYGLALQAFEKYLAEAGDDIVETRRDEVLREVDRLRKMVGYVKLTAPDGTEISIDGVARGTAPLNMEIPLAAGVDHEVVGELPGKWTDTEDFVVSGGKTLFIDLSEPRGGEAPAVVAAPQPAPAEEVDEPTEPEPAPPEEQRDLVEDGAGDGANGMMVGGWVAVGIGGALLITGVGTGAAALSLNGDIGDSCDSQGECPSAQKDEIDRRDTLATTSTVFFSIGAVVAATGITLLLVDHLGNEGDSPGEQLALGVDFAHDRGGLTLRGRF